MLLSGHSCSCLQGGIPHQQPCTLHMLPAAAAVRAQFWQQAGSPSLPKIARTKKMPRKPPSAPNPKRLANPGTPPQTPPEGADRAAAQNRTGRLAALGKGPGDAQRPSLEQLGMTRLGKKAAEYGVDEDEVEAAIDAGDKDKLVDMIVAAMNQAPKGPGDAERPSLEKLGLTKLGKKAAEYGVDEDEVEAAIDAGDKDKLVDMIVAAMNSAPPQPEPETAAIEEPVHRLDEPAVDVAERPGLDQLGLDRLAKKAAGRTLLDLVNDLMDINISTLNIGTGLEWPQICVVGGQSEGKSTLLSAVRPCISSGVLFWQVNHGICLGLCAPLSGTASKCGHAMCADCLRPHASRPAASILAGG
jgi:DNA-binding protein YbaB